MENATLALVPSLLWLGLFIRVRGEGLWQEPHWLLALSFATGMMVTAPAMAVEKFVLGAWDEQGQTALSLVTGPVEELAKYIAVSAGVMDLRRLAPGLLETGQIKPERNGALHAAAAAMGFAAVENFLYLNTFGAQAILLRGPVSTLHHLSMALIWGLALAGQGGRTKMEGKLTVIAALALSAAIHTGLNLSTGVWSEFPVALAPLSLAWTAWAARRTVRSGNKPTAQADPIG